MTTGGNDVPGTREDDLLARLYRQGTDRQAARYAASYDAEAGLARFAAWLQEHATADAFATATNAGAGAAPVPLRPADTTDTPAASAIGTDAFPASAPANISWSADRACIELYSLHYWALVHLAAMLVRDVPTAEEVVQDAFVAMHDAWPRLRDANNALAYLRQAVVNRSRSVLRHRTVVERNLQQAPPDTPGTEHEALHLLERSAVIAALRGLPVRQREAIVLRYYADLSEAEVAATMGISRGAVKSHTARGMAALRAALEQE